jgi:hypothetical protein
MNGWTDSRKFWAETIRAMVFGLIGAAAATIFLGVYADADRVQRDIRAKSIDSFLIASNQYTATAYDFCSRSNGDDDVKKLFESTVVDNYHAAIFRMGLYFANDDVRSKVDMIKDKETRLFKVCKEDNSPRENWQQLRCDLKKANEDLAKAAIETNEAPLKSAFWFK